MRRFLPLLGVFLLVLAGCSKSTTESVVAEDGSWKRTVKFTIAKAMMSEKAPNAADAFELPRGTGWNVKQETKDEELIVTATRDIPAGTAEFTDISVLGKEKKKKAQNSVVVRALGEGKFEYVETIKWVGEKSTKVDDLAKPMAELAKHLPEVDEPTRKLISEDLVVAMHRLMFGPNEPILPLFLLSPDFAVRKMKIGLSAAIDKSLQTRVGDKLDATARRNVIRKMLSTLDTDEVKPKQDDAEKAGGGSNDDPTGFLGMMFSVKFPGEILETNGILDPIDNEVVWSMFVEGAEVETVTLRAVWQVK